MGQFNEIQKGVPDLGKNYWQDLRKDSEDLESDIIKLNCQTIYNFKNFNKKNCKSIFEQ